MGSTCHAHLPRPPTGQEGWVGDTECSLSASHVAHLCVRHTLTHLSPPLIIIITVPPLSPPLIITTTHQSCVFIAITSRLCLPVHIHCPHTASLHHIVYSLGSLRNVYINAIIFTFKIYLGKMRVALRELSMICTKPFNEHVCTLV